MADSERESVWDLYDGKSDLLQQALEMLVKRGESNQGGASGLQKTFTEKNAMQLMEQSMELLATDYVTDLELFKSADDPIELLTHLENSEALWRSQSKIIEMFDASGEETTFLFQMRTLAQGLFLEKLEVVSELAGQDASANNVACCIGLMAVIDHIWEGEGRALQDPDRQRFRKIVASFR